MQKTLQRSDDYGDLIRRGIEPEFLEHFEMKDLVRLLLFLQKYTFGLYNCHVDVTNEDLGMALDQEIQHENYTMIKHGSKGPFAKAFVTFFNHVDAKNGFEIIKRAMIKCEGRLIQPRWEPIRGQRSRSAIRALRLALKWRLNHPDQRLPFYIEGILPPGLA